MINYKTVKNFDKKFNLGMVTDILREGERERDIYINRIFDVDEFEFYEVY